MSKNNEMYTENILNIVIKLIKIHIFRLITKKSTALFLKGRDSISIAPQVFGLHEEPLGELIKYYVEKEYSDFLIDIGANIGLIACQNGKYFKEIHMFEPNPLCTNILEVNAKLALESNRFFIYKYGLGDSDKKTKLTVPKHNWGGAFIRDKNNSYSDEILAFKDGFNIIDDKNYFEADIVVCEAKNKLKELFEMLANKNFNKGIVKIDVEGYEESIILSISESIPKNSKIIILFESWNKDFDIKKIIESFEGRCVVKKMQRIVPWRRGASTIKKILWLIIAPTIRYKIIEIKEGEMDGDIILEIS